MTNPVGQHTSPWIDTLVTPDLGATQAREVEVDVVVVGAGITGVTTALLLRRSGRRVAVVEARRVGAGVTTHSTVKVTVGHGLRYSKIADQRGLDAAAAYAQANVAGLQQIFDLAQELQVGRLQIDCMLEQGLPHVIYAESDDEAEQVRREAEIAARIGLPAALTQTAPVPFDVSAAVRFDGQAQFHPGRYLAGLIQAFVAEGGAVIEGVRARGVDEDRDMCKVTTSTGTLSAPHVVVATHYPFLNRGGHFASMKAHRSYGIAGILPQGVAAGMTINVGSPTHSTRTVTLGGEELLIVVGESHEVGHVTDTAQRWANLRRWARDRFGVDDFRYYWSAQETSTLDHVPFVGFIAPGSERVLIATGFDGWGMTNGTASAILIRDLIVGQPNSWAATFDARRALRRLPGRDFVSHNLQVGTTWLRDRLAGPPRGSAAQLQPGTAAVLKVGGEDVAAYRDDQGALHAVAAVCTHLGCNVEWNDGEKSWDCPCHGSRFSPDGEVLHGPASSDLAARELG